MYWQRLLKAELNERGINYHLEIIELLKGKSESNFELVGESLESPYQASDFNNHEDEGFWLGAGRSLNNTMCNIRPSFAVGQVYLIFLNPIEFRHVKNYELILSSHDYGTKK